jgi:UDP-arabinose 4-epimerase
MALVLITGGAGYVGSHCAKALAAANHEAIVLDNLILGHRDFVR